MGKSFFSTEARKYALYGVAFGFLFPLFGTFFEAWRLAGEVTRHSLFLVQSRNLLLWVIDTAPFWLGLFAWMAGKRQDIVVAQGRLLALEFGEADKARQLLDAQLSRILESSRDEIFLFRADDWKFIQANRGALNNLGYTEAEIRTLTPLVLFPELDRKTLAAHLRPLRLGEQKQISFETVEERKDGSQCPVEVRVHSAGEETPLLYTAMVLDISGRRQVQLLVQEERKKFFEILENLPIAFHLQAPDYSIPYANKMFRKRFGADTDQPCFSILYKRSGPGGTGTPFKVFDTGRQQSALRTAFDGRTYMTVRNPYTDVDGSPLIMEMAMDITEQEEAKQEAITARQVAEKANRAKSQFLARMSHELRTPLNAVLGFSQLLALEGEGRFTALDMEGLQMIGDAGKHLLDLVNEILDLSRIDAGKMKISPQTVHLGTLLQELGQLVQPLAENHGVQVAVEPAGPEVGVFADPVRLKQILLNLMSNAIKYNRPGGRVIIRIQTRSGGRLAVRVEDTGVGIPAEEMDRIFEPFHRLEGSGEREGTGIGLTITRRLTEMMNGKLEVESTLGAGSCFTVEVPARPVECAVAPPPPAS